MATTSTMTSDDRSPAFTLPKLHLGSFHSLTPDSFPSPTSPTRISPTSPLLRTSGNTSTQNGYWDGPVSADMQQPPSANHDASARTPLRPSASRDRLRESTYPPMSGSSPPHRLPLNLALPPIPPSNASPSTENRTTSGGPTGTSLGLPLPYDPSSWAPDFSSPTGSSWVASRTRPLGPSLTIHIPSPLTPSSSIDKDGLISPAVLRNSPIPRRRTIVEGNPTTPRASPVRVSNVMGTMTPPQDGVPEVTARRSSLDPSTAVRPADLTNTNRVTTPEKKLVTDTKRVSPASPSKRALPRPPSGSQLDSRSSSIPPGAQPSALSSHVTQIPVSASTWPPPSGNVSLVPASFRRQETPVQHQSLAQKHQTTNSASSLPVVAGLADAGPYPSSSTTPRQPASNQAMVANGIGRNSLAGPSRPPAVQNGIPNGGQEEVCLECMMRDRDLADVVVQGSGVWERSSDAAWDELRWREEALLKRSGSVLSSAPSLDHSISGSEDNSTTSPPSTGHSLEDAQRLAHRRDRQLRRARRRERDRRVVAEVGWRGFRWEEGGAGLPEHFRGCRGGPLTEDGIKAIMTKFPSASQHRYDALHTYLRHQALLIREIQLEAQRLGHYPGEPTSSVIAGPRTSSVAWEAHARELDEQLRHRPIPPEKRQLPKPLSHVERNRDPPAPLNFAEKATAAAHDDDWDDEWSPMSPAGSGLRPFSFAVRAAARGSSDGHGRRSLWGRWGGSVTSLFGGSQGGSGSMVDMHLGLENERDANQYSHPRAVSLVSPTRASFGGRESRASSVSGGRVVQSISSSRLSQMLRNETDEETKKKGFKALLRKMKPKGHRSDTEPKDEASDLETPLAPPPRMSHLVGTRNRSGSLSSQTDVSTSAPTKRSSGSLPPGIRSVSAPVDPLIPSISPSSSRFAPRRESHASVQGRRRSLMANELGDGSAVEMLNGRFHASPEPTSLYEEPPTVRASHLATYPPPSARPHNKTTSSLSASTYLETPPAVPAAMPFFDRKNSDAPKNQLSPNRYKNLPPLPPSDNIPPYSTSPDPFAPYDEHDTRSPYDRLPRRAPGAPPPLGTPRHREKETYQQPRSSFDPGERPTRRHKEISPRMAQSMYVQPSAAGSTGSFGRFMGVAGRRQDSGTPIDLSDGKSVRSKKGFKGFFTRS